MAPKGVGLTICRHLAKFYLFGVGLRKSFSGLDYTEHIKVAYHGWQQSA